MADLERAKQALINAHNAGDTEAATKLATYIKSQQAQPVETPAPQKEKMNSVKAFLVGLQQGPTFGFADELAAFGAGVGGALRPDTTYSEQYERRLAEKRGELSQAKERPVASIAGELTGAIGAGGGIAKLGGAALGKIAATAPLRTAAATGALSGGVYGFGAGEGGGAERLQQGTVSAIAGGLLAPLGVLAGRGVSKVAEGLKKPGQEAIEGGAQEIAERMEDAATAIRPATPAQENAATQKVMQAIKRDFPKDYERVLEAWKSGDKTLAEYYGPNITRLAKGAAQYRGGEAQAKKFFEQETLAAPERMKQAVSKNISAVENYFTTAEDFMKAGKEKAKPAYEKAFGSVKGISDQRINEFLQAPELKTGIQRGLKIQRLEALAEGKPFNPMDYAITDFNEAGDAIIGKVPNMRLLDAGKRGLDAMIQEQTDATTGRVTEMGRALIMTKNAYVNELRRINPYYDDALKTAGDYFKIDNAMKSGKEFMNIDPENIKKSLSKMTDDEKTAFKIGVGKQIRDLIDKTGEGGNPFNKVFGNKFQRDRLMAVLSPEEFKGLESGLRAENRLFKMRNEVLGGSPTTSKAIAAAEIAAGGADALQTLATGNIKAVGLSQVKNIITKAFDGINDRTAEQISRIIYETDPAQKVILLERVVKNPQLTEAEKQIVKKAYFAYDDIAKNAIRSGLAVSPVAAGFGGAVVGQ